MNNTIKFFVDKKNTGKRLDIFLSENMKNFTRSFIKKLIENKNVKSNNIIITSPSTKVKYENEITISIANKKEKNLKPKKID